MGYSLSPPNPPLDLLQMLQLTRRKNHRPIEQCDRNAKLRVRELLERATSKRF